MADDEVIDGAANDGAADEDGELERLRVDMPFDQTNYDLLEVSTPLLRGMERLEQERLERERLERERRPTHALILHAPMSVGSTQERLRFLGG